jgi:hypothetical protein
LAKEHRTKVKGRIEQGLFYDKSYPSSKAKFVNALANAVKEESITAELREMPAPKKRRKRRESSLW